MNKLDNLTFDQLFNKGRSHYYWLKKEIEDSLLEELYNLVKFCPTSMNGSPARIFFIKTIQAKERLKKCLPESNIKKAMDAPVTAIIAYDLKFYEKLPFLFPHQDVQHIFKNNENLTFDTAFRNSSLQGAYLILAARSLGLDCGAMSGFNNEALDKEFFLNTNLKSNFLCNLGYGDYEKLYPRNPRLSFNDACKIL